MRGAPVPGGGRARLLALVVAAAALAVAPRLARAVTDAADVSAINGLYVALGSPTLPEWTGNGGDPCGELWQGVVCTGSSIISVTMIAANLGGHLGSLGNFTSIITINLSNNKIGGTIPEDLPVTLQHLFLSANQLTGSIPSSLAKLKNLTAMSLNENQLNGELPDAFDSLPGLVNLDISSNNMTGMLPPSMKGLSSLTTLRMQGNQLSGTLNVLQDLPLKDLNIENNLFSGPVPAKLLNIPNFKKDGNPFNTSIAPSASPPSTQIGPAPTPTPTRPAPSLTPTGSKPAPTPTPTGPNPIPSSSPPSASRAPPSSTTPSNSSDRSTNRDSTSSSKKKNSSTLKIIGFVLLGVVLFIIIALLVIFCLSKHQERQSRSDYNRSQRAKVHHTVEPKINPSSVQPRDDGEALDRRVREPSLTAAALPKKPSENQREHIINLERTDSDLFAVAPPPPPPPLPLLPVQKVVVNPVVPPEKRYSSPPRTSNPISATPFSVASLQQYTSSFREENLIRESRLGKVYLAELPEGKLLEVMKIDNPNGRISVDDFIELVDHISDLKHPNILELVGYCAEYGQRLLVYNHFSRKTLDDALHDGEDIDNALSWNARLQVALGSGKVLEYLHESFQPPIVHQNFEPANVLLDNKFSVCVAECGLAEQMPSSSVTQLLGRMRALLYYEAPEFQEARIITERGDVYSFGVVMLELLTGRKPYDSSRPPAEQHLVRWANSQLHDIESLSKMVDPSIRGHCPEKALSRFADIISRCIQREPEFRPPISEIVQDLARIVHATGEESE